MVFLDVEIKGQPVGRIEMVLFTDVSPRAAENFRWGSTSQVGEAACVYIANWQGRSQWQEVSKAAAWLRSVAQRHGLRGALCPRPGLSFAPPDQGRARALT